MSAEQKRNIFVKRIRHAEGQRIRRRQKFLAKALVTLPPETFSREEAIDLLLGPLADAKRALRRAERRHVVAPAEDGFLPRLPQDGGNLPTAPRPTHVLSRLNRSAVFPPLLPDQVEIEALALNEIVAALRLKCLNMPAHRLLDAFVNASGLPWELCAKILLSRGLFTKPIDGQDLAATRGAREFRNQYGQGRARYAVLSVAKRIQEFQGDWAYFDDRKFEALLPEITVPTKLKRDQYFTNWLSSGNPSSVDVYAAPTREPLFQHQFPENFNPLFFGKPRVNVGCR